MLIPKGNGKMYDTFTKELVDDPQARNQSRQAVKDNMVDYEELLGISGEHHFTLNPPVPYLITEDEWNLATEDSREFVAKVYNDLLSDLSHGVLPKTSLLLALGHKMRTLDTVASILLNAHTGGLTVEHFTQLYNLDHYDLSQYSKDLMVVVLPVKPTNNDISTITSLLVYRDSINKPTILVDPKYTVKDYRYIWNTDDQPRYDLVTLVALKQDRNTDALQSIVRNTKFSFQKTRKLEQKANSQPVNTEVQDDLASQLRKDYIDITEYNAVDASHRLFPLGGESD